MDSSLWPVNRVTAIGMLRDFENGLSMIIHYTTAFSQAFCVHVILWLII
jgi:hypothetical protein